MNETALENSAEAPLEQRLLSRLVQPAGVMSWQHLPGSRIQRAAGTLMQRSHLPAQIQARYTAVGQISLMALPGRSRVEALALGASVPAELVAPDVGLALGLPTLDSHSSEGRVSAFSDPGAALNQHSGASEPLLQAPVSTSAPGLFRVSRQPTVEGASPPTVQLRQTVNVSASAERSPAPSLSVPTSPIALVMQQPMQPPLADAAKPATGSAAPIAPTEQLQRLPVGESAPSPAPIAPVSPSVPESMAVPRITAQLPSPGGESAAPLPLALTAANPGSSLSRFSSQPAPSFPQTMRLSIPAANSQSHVSRRIDPPGSEVPRISQPLISRSSGEAIAPAPLPWSGGPTVTAIARVPAETMPPLETSVSSGSTSQPIPAAATAASSTPNLKQMATQVSRLLQRQLIVERERRGLRSW